MLAAVAPTLGGPDVVRVQEIDRPALQPGTARVAVAKAAVNFPDLLVLAGRYQAKVEPPYTPGCEFSGRVLEVAPGVTRVEPGDVVFGLATHGAFAEEIVLDAERLTRVSQPMPWEVLAAFGVTYTTAYHALHTFARLQPGEQVTVLGAAGGVGLAAIDLVRVMGGRAIAVASGAQKLDVCRTKGAVALIDATAGDLKARLNDATSGGADVVLDPVGGGLAEPALRAMRWGGRYVVLGFAAGEIPRIPLNLVLLKGVWLTGFENRTILDHLPEVAAAHRAEVLQMLLDGTIQPHIGATYPLADVGDALREIAERRAIGKVVVDITPEL